jgi:hypothetical protein
MRLDGDLVLGSEDQNFLPGLRHEHRDRGDTGLERI